MQYSIKRTNMKTAIFPGSFDPFTIGHESIVKRALPMFDNIIIMIGFNANKKSFFSLEKRLKWINQVFKIGRAHV